MTQYYDIPDISRPYENLRIEAKNIDGLPPIPINNALWKEWEPEVQQHRTRIHELTGTKWSGQQAARDLEVQRVRKDGRYWLSTYGAIYQGKDDEQEQDESEDWVTSDEQTSGWVLPFIPYVYQLYWWDWQIKAFKSRGTKGDTAIVKTRQMGMSNVACAMFNWAWMVRKPFQGRLLSRKEDLVDETNNPDSLFWKLKLQLSAQPEWLLHAFAPGFDWRSHYMEASLTNPSNFNHLAGESTNATAGRGGNVTAILLDEFAFMRGGGGIWTATRSASNHRIAISTVSLKTGTHFYDLVTQPEESRPAVMYIPYWLHPYHDDAWLEQERKRDTEAGIQIEVLMNWHGDESSLVYPGLSGKSVGDYPYTPFAGPTFVAFDDGYRNNWAFWVIQYITSTGRHRIIDYYENNQQVVDFYGSLWRGLMVDGFEYGENEREIQSLMRYIQEPIYIGDTHGHHAEMVAGQSVHERLASKWGIFVNVDYNKREYKDRQEYTARYLPYTDWNDTPRVKQGLLRVQTFKWKEMPEGAEPTSWVKEPVKNQSADAATALEYYFTNFEAFKFVYSGAKFSYE